MMNIAQAKEQIKDTIEAYFAKDADGCFYIDPLQQRPIFLLGAPGIGKTAIMAQIADELGIGLVSYSMTHHTRQSALGLPRIVSHEYKGFSYEASEYTMSEIIASIYEYMRTSGVERGILFLDEINCVSETLYPSMLQFLQMKTFGSHKIPDGWAVVCAGNPPEYNRSVHEFDIVTLDRLRKIEIEPDFEAWKAYVQDVGVHPAILTFLEVKKECFYRVESKPGEKVFVTARGWNDLSKVITLFEKLGKKVGLELISQFLQNDEIAEMFAQYYLLFNKYRSDYQIGHILSGDADEELVERARSAAFDERIALIGLLLDALSNHMEAVCDEERMLVGMRDALRSAKPALAEGASVDETIGADIRSIKERLAKARETRSASTKSFRFDSGLVHRLGELVDVLASEGKMAGQEALSCATQTFQEQAGKLAPLSVEVEGQLAHAFAFLDEAFGADEREVLVFVTELTARRETAQFISRYGSASYYAHNDGLMVDRYQQDLLSRIDGLGLDGIVVEGAQVRLGQGDGASGGSGGEPGGSEAPSGKGQAGGETRGGKDVSPAALKTYYAGAQFEYGMPSLCKMTLPDDLWGKTVLDIGCRRGKGVFKLSSRVGNEGHVIGVDWNKAYIEEASAKQERAWKDSGLLESNMEFKRAYPEDLHAAGIEDASIDVVFINSVSNIACSPQALFAELYRVLRPGGIVINETVLADVPRDAGVVEQARALGNSVQAAPCKADYEDMLARAGFSAVRYDGPEPVAPTDGALLEHPVEAVDSDEQVAFTAMVTTVTK